MNLNYLLRKIFQSLVALIIAVTIGFVLFRMLGSPRSMMIKEGIPVATVEAIMEQRGYNLPIYQQYFRYLADLVLLDFGDSYTFKRPVADILADRLPNTVLLALTAQIIAITLGIILGTIAAAFRGKPIDVLVLGASLFFYATPTFWMGMIFISFFGGRLGWFPLFGMTRPGAFYADTWAWISDVAYHLVMPATTFALLILGSYTMIMRGSLLDIFTEDYIATARAKGLRRWTIIRRHALPNAMLPMVTIIAINLGFVVTGAIQSETVFSWPGVGLLIFRAMEANDFPLLQAGFLITSICVIAANFLADITYMFLDPRIRYER